MGFVNLFKNIIGAHLIIYTLLITHVLVQMFFMTPDDPDYDQFPKSFTQKDKDELIESRKPLIANYLKSMKQLKMDEFAAKWFTDDVEYIDSFQHYVTREEVKSYLTTYSPKLYKNIDVFIRSEYHGPHEVILELTYEFAFNLLPNTPLKLPINIRFLLEPPSKQGGSESVFKMTQELLMTEVLTERNCPKIFADIHKRLRRSHSQIFLNFL